MLGLRNGVVQLHEAIGPPHSSDPTFYTNKMNFYMGSLPFSIWLLISTEQSTFTHTNLILSTYCESETKMHQWGGSWNKPMEIFAPGLYLWQTQFDGDGLTDGLRGASLSCCVGALQLHSCIVVRSGCINVIWKVFTRPPTPLCVPLQRLSCLPPSMIIG